MAGTNAFWEQVKASLEDVNLRITYRRYDAEQYWFHVDPLNNDIPLRLLVQQCDCNPEAFHSKSCPAAPIHAALVIETLDALEETSTFLEHYWPDRWACPPWWCCTAGNLDDYDTSHRLGEINGPVHWCEAQKRVVGPDDEAP